LEILSQNAQQSLEFLIYATIIMLIIITVFLVKLLADLSSLAKSTQSLVAVVKHDLGPTMKELKRALININSITNSTTTQFSSLNTALNDSLNILSHSSKGVASGAKVLFSSLKRGVLTGLKVFLEQKNKSNG